MLSWGTHLHRFLWATVVLGLAGCSGSLGPKFVPLEYESSEIANATADQIHRRLSRLEPGPRLIDGMTIANIRCDQFFEKLDEYQTNANFAINRLTDLSIVLPGILGNSGVSQKVVANTLASIGFASNLIRDKKTLFLLSEFKSDVYNNWQQSRDLHFRKNLKIALFLNNQTSSTGDRQVDQLLKNEAMAESLVNTALYEYARLCLRSQLKKYIYDHVKKPITVKKPGTENQTEVVTTTTTTTGGGGGRGVDDGGAIIDDGTRSSRRHRSGSRSQRRVIRRTTTRRRSDDPKDFIWTQPIYGGG
jgi:hypothetical protein